MRATIHAGGEKIPEDRMAATVADAGAWAAVGQVGVEEVMAGGAAAEKAMNSGRKRASYLRRQKPFGFP